MTAEHNELKLNAYYYSFGPTGFYEIDLILSAVARAGKAYHHTGGWLEKSSPYDERFTGECPIDWIQNAAKAAADTLAAREAEIAGLHEEVEALRAMVPRWIPVTERLPDSNKIVLAAYQNDLGKWRIVRAFWCAKMSRESDGESDLICDYDEAADIYYWPEGWYEDIENWEEYGAVTINNPVLCWQPLPPPPTGDRS